MAVVVTDPDHRGDAPRVWGEPEPHDRLALLDLTPGTGSGSDLDPPNAAHGLRPITGLGELHVLEVSARPDGAALAVITRPSPLLDPVRPRWDLHLVDTATEEVSDLGPPGWDAHSPTWWHDGRHWHLSYLAMDPGPDGGQAVFDLIPGSGGAGAATSPRVWNGAPSNSPRSPRGHHWPCSPAVSTPRSTVWPPAPRPSPGSRPLPDSWSP